MMRKVLISSLCFDYRDNILFYAYMMQLDNLHEWRRFATSCSNHKIKGGLIYKYALDDSVKYVGRVYFKLLRLRERMQKGKTFPPIPVYEYKEKLYPANGSKRIACSIFLGFKHVKIIKAVGSDVKKWNRNYSIDGPLFQNLPEDIKEKYLRWRVEYFKKSTLLLSIYSKEGKNECSTDFITEN